MSDLKARTGAEVAPSPQSPYYRLHDFIAYLDKVPDGDFNMATSERGGRLVGICLVGHMLEFDGRDTRVGTHFLMTTATYPFSCKIGIQKLGQSFGINDLLCLYCMVGHTKAQMRAILVKKLETMRDLRQGPVNA